jgi:hypothetical protein
VLVMRARYAKARVQGSRSGEGAGRVHLNLVERGEGFGDELAGGQMGEAIFAGLVRSCSDSERRAASRPGSASASGASRIVTAGRRVGLGYEQGRVRKVDVCCAELPRRWPTVIARWWRGALRAVLPSTVRHRWSTGWPVIPSGGAAPESDAVTWQHGW